MTSCRVARQNKYKFGKIFMVWHKKCNQIHLASTVKSLAEKKGAYGVSEDRNQKSTLFDLAESFGGIRAFEFTLLEKFPCNCLAELELRENLWKSAFPRGMQIGSIVQPEQAIVFHNSLRTFLQSADDHLKKFTDQIFCTEAMAREFLNKPQVKDYEADARYKNAYIYTLRIEGQKGAYYGSSIKKPADKRLSHIYDAACGEPGKAYDFFRQFGVQNIILEVIENYPCENEIELKLKENEYILRHLGTSSCLNSQLAVKNGKKPFNRYKSGIIYVMVCEECPKLYLGSTIQPLERRKMSHVAKARMKSKSNFYKTARSYGGVENFKILKLECWACNSKRELEEREQFWKDALAHVLLNQNNPRSSDEVKKEKKRLYHAARARPQTEAEKQKARETIAQKRETETPEQKKNRLEQKRSYNRLHDEHQRNVKNAKRLVTRLNAEELFTPKSTTLDKYGIYRNSSNFFISKLLEQLT